MTDEEIKKIAREYAEYCCQETDYEGDIVERNMDLHICADEVAMPLLEWLSKDYCVVQKSKVQNLFGEYNTKRIDAALFGGDMAKYRHKMEVLTTLFGKSLFNEEKE